MPLPLRILLTEGSSLSAREVLYALGGRHVIDVCDPRPWLCLARYSRFVRRVHRCPIFTREPAEYLHFVKRLLEGGGYDVLIPPHDETYLLARFADRLRRRVAHALPDFASLERLQSKSTFADLLEELDLPRPLIRKVRNRQELEEASILPAYVKLPYSTAGQGVWKVDDHESVKNLAQRLEIAGAFQEGGEVLVQHVVVGTLCVAQSVFRRGELAAAHTYRARALGVGGSAYVKEGVDHPQVREHLGRIGAALRWHGPLMLDYLHDFDTNTTCYLECNPRIGETGNALANGIDLCQHLVDIATDVPTTASAPGRVGVRTHSTMMALMGLAQQGGTRTALVRELRAALRRQDVFAGSSDELTRPWVDPPSLLPALYVGARLLVRPGAVRNMVGGAVSSYALTREAAGRIRMLPEDV